MFCFAGFKKDATDFCIEKAFPFCQSVLSTEMVQTLKRQLENNVVTFWPTDQPTKNSRKVRFNKEKFFLQDKVHLMRLFWPCTASISKKSLMASDFAQMLNSKSHLTILR
jgi:hypothetical protein